MNNIKQDLPKYKIYLPSGVRFHPNLHQGAKWLLGEIACPSVKNGFCFATNSFFAKIYGVHNRTISEWIRNLKTEKLIKIQHIKSKSTNCDERRIFINRGNPAVADFFATQGKKILYSCEENIQVPHEKNYTDNISRRNNTRLRKSSSIIDCTNSDSVSESELNSFDF